jgi:hypothetical protein
LPPTPKKLRINLLNLKVTVGVMAYPSLQWPESKAIPLFLVEAVSRHNQPELRDSSLLDRMNSLLTNKEKIIELLLRVFRESSIINGAGVGKLR